MASMTEKEKKEERARTVTEALRRMRQEIASLVGGAMLVTSLTATGAITAGGGFFGDLTGNAASASVASALANTVTLWGRDFNGANNVVGAIEDATDITASGRLLMGVSAHATGTPRATIGGSVIQMVLAETMTDATQKNARFGAAHYTNSEEPVAVFVVNAAVSDSTVRIGGGSSVLNAATALVFYTGATNTTTTGTEAARFNTSQNFLIGTGTAVSGSARLDVAATGASNVALVITDVTTDATQKVGRFGARHYTNSEEPMAAFVTSAGVGSNSVLIGGGTSAFNAATFVAIYTAANHTTTTGTQRASWNSAGLFTQVGDATIGGVLTVNGHTKLYPADSTIANLRNTLGTVNSREWSFRIDTTTGALSLRSVLDSNTTVATSFTLTHATGAIGIDVPVTISLATTGQSFAVTNSSNTASGEVILATRTTDSAVFGASWIGRRSRTTGGAVQNNDVLSGIYGQGHDGTSFYNVNVGAIRILAAETHTTGPARGTKIDFATTLIGASTRTVRGTITDAGLFDWDYAMTVDGIFTANLYGSVGGAASDAVRWYVRGTLSSSNATQYGTFINPTFTSSATSGINGLYVQLLGGAGGHATTDVSAINVAPYTLGASQTVTNLYGLVIQSSSTVATTSYGIRVGNITGGGTSYSLYTDAGLVRLGGQTTLGGTYTATTGLSVAAILTATSAQTSAIRVTSTLTAAANNDVLSAVRIAPTYSVGAFTGTTGHGVFIENITGAATNYAIYTGTGLVRLGDRVTIRSTSTPQFTAEYDGSNYWTASVSSAGAVTLDAVGASAGFTFSDSVTVAGVLTLNPAAANGVIFIPVSNSFTILSNTSDGSDTATIEINAGGGTTSVRGAFLRMDGADHATRPGGVTLGAGFNGVATTSVSMTNNSITLSTGGLVTLVGSAGLSLAAGSGVGNVIVNENGNNVDFRVESDQLQRAIWVDASEENLAFVVDAAPAWQSMEGGIFIGNASVVPTGNPTGGGYMYAEAGAGKWRGSSGTITTFGPAEPHCPECGSDFGLEYESKKYGYLAVCLSCLTNELGDRKWIRKQKPKKGKRVA